MPAPHDSRRPFLTARWRRLVLAQYRTDPALLEPLLPAGLELDRWQGETYVSLVAFEFLDTRVRGVRVPGCVNFPELNLRFYVRDGDRRGVCFVREFVPSRLTSLVARVVYNEPYARASMRVATAQTDEDLLIDHRIQFGGRAHRVNVRAGIARETPPDGSLEHHFKEHEWGFGRTRAGKPTRYRVQHPVWETHRVREVEIDIDAAVLYGPSWAWLTDTSPDSVVVAAGSEIAVFPWTARD